MPCCEQTTYLSLKSGISKYLFSTLLSAFSSLKLRRSKYHVDTLMSMNPITLVLNATLAKKPADHLLMQKKKEKKKRKKKRKQEMICRTYAPNPHNEEKAAKHRSTHF